LVTVDRTTTGDTDAEVAEEPAGPAAAWSSDTGGQPGDPDDRKGDHIAKSEKDENSRPEKLRSQI
jgi:hypothetical protein